ncbi:MAG: NAD(P)/FAD-dependent oxidoreductase, partial [Dehalococcoidia bacterium]
GGRWSWLISPYIKAKVATLKKMGVRLQLGKLIDAKALQRIKPDAVIVTVGKTPIIPQIPGIEQSNVVHADDVLNGKVDTKGTAVILGGGNIGFETAEFLRRRNIQTVIIESGQEIGYGIERDARAVLAQRLPKYGIRVFNGTDVVRIKGDQVYYRDADGKDGSIKAGSVILAYGSEPDNKLIDLLQAGSYELLTVNHCERPEDVYKATQEGAAAARNI